ncbi:bifunctional methyltransferase/pyrophosphohydrolase YabN [Selenihalanaerobacter shriftii]|uniref:Tetrapyrrole methylase family protein / MazG family protein n=1 Tax=Selenihalanaerobacter shriftii TaxID=142842 RepID=A0A1T4N442_9FIRM|nr:nucleoside triphosphate pyrophosphohydrolase [Selenihalanaerobacter shriftii]SJZ74099.1 tetrapyrrole methylase family protein / MazG family protein [Selenihalanaerobacter shriftii]
MESKKGTLTIIGLGPGKMEDLTLGAHKALEEVDKLFIRTKEHPIIDELVGDNLDFNTFDKVYEREDNFEQVYEVIAKRLIQEINKGLNIGYAVPGNPLVAEKSVQNLLNRLPNEKLDIISGESFLDVLFTLLNIDPIEGMQVLDALSFAAEDIQFNQNIILTQVYNRLIASDVKLTLLEVYPENHQIQVVKAAGIVGLEKKVEIPLYQLDRLEWVDHLTSVYIPPLHVEQRNKFNKLEVFNTLVRIMEKLRSPNGCPWDLEQDHLSLRPYLIEETYEVLEEIENGDRFGLCEELGDLLLQVIFHAQIAKEENNFDIEDVIYSISEKMIRRHPHVFGDEDLSTSDDVLKKWDEIKASEKSFSSKDFKSVLDITDGLPALMEAQKVQKKAAGVGFDWPIINQVLDKLEEELSEFKEALTIGQKSKIREELGDVLFATVNVGRFLELDLELVLRDATQKFKKRFRYIEKAVRKTENDLNDMTLNELEELWQQAKEELN